MFDHGSLITWLGLIAVAAPVLLLGVLGVPSLANRRLSEEATGKACQVTIITGFLASLTILALMLVHGTRYEAIGVGEWVHIPHYHFSVKLVFDRLSVPFAYLASKVLEKRVEALRKAGDTTQARQLEESLHRYQE